MFPKRPFHRSPSDPNKGRELVFPSLWNISVYWEIMFKWLHSPVWQPYSYVKEHSISNYSKVSLYIITDKITKICLHITVYQYEYLCWGRKMFFCRHKENQGKFQFTLTEILSNLTKKNVFFLLESCETYFFCIFGRKTVSSDYF